MPEINPPHDFNLEAINLQNSAAELEASLLANIIHPREVVDQANFKRERYAIGNTGLEVEFRGLEELPETALPGDARTHVVLGADRLPVRTGRDEFGQWAQTITASQQQDGLILGEPTPESFDAQIARVWEQATSRQAEAVVLHAPATPEGIIDVALQLCEVGLGSPNRKDALLQMRAAVRDRNYGQQEEQLLDSIFALVDAQIPHVQGEEAKPMEHGLIIAALALAGEAEAETLSGIRQTEARARDIGTFTTRVYGFGEEAKGRVAMPGDKVPLEVIESVKEKHLVSVHTSPVKPLLGNIIRPTAEMNVGEADQFPRDSIHFSLNHSVVNNVRIGENGAVEENDFKGRPFTMIAPIEGLLENNGAPFAMADVDTYFVAGPGNGIILPASTITLEVVSDTAEATQPLIIEGNKLTFHPDGLQASEGVVAFGTAMREWTNAADMASLDSMPGMRYMHDKSEEGKSPEELAFKYLESKMKALVSYNSLISIGRELEDVEGVDEFKTLAGEFIAEAEVKSTTKPNSQLVRAFVEALPVLMSSPSLRPKLTEKLRVLLTNEAIKNLGGKVVEAGSHYTLDSSFQKSTQEAAAEIGITTGLHSSNDESNFEGAYWNAVTGASDIETVKSETGNTEKLQRFNWDRFDSSSMWYWLGKSPRQMRRRAIEMGILTFSKPSPIESTVRKSRG